MKFALSNRQAKELIDRGRPLRIAIPAPDVDDYDPRAWFAAAMPGIDPGWIVSVERLTLPISPTRKDGGEGLGAAIGSIVHDDHRRAALTILVECLVAELRASRVSRQPLALTQWAGRIIAEAPGDTV